ncbi:hypothetical protein M422DRAFT_257502 [Sphaerobolus stellatus SS14]|uniref:Uncharacterized protein n=1 Tax=Sphaerobolus stellatus (strain SS14) TaxID=990650 RepID=A0A0C9VE38_SPHS4|nr:hypothetical protein M422DRAFT_257502 [Sphaerobolus stellatus SS14]
MHTKTNMSNNNATSNPKDASNSDVCDGPESSTSDVAQINEPPKALYKLNPNVFSVLQLLAHEIQSKQSTPVTKDAVEAFEKQGAEKRKAKAGAR